MLNRSFLMLSVIALVLPRSGQAPTVSTPADPSTIETSVVSQSALPTITDANGPAAVAESPEPTFEAGPCPFAVPEGSEDDVVCGFVIVPEHHGDPKGPAIRLAVAIVKDQSDEHQPDPVMLLHGGPGERTVANALGWAQALGRLHPNRDLVIFDQRGVGSSEPALECPVVEENYLAHLEETDPNSILKVVFDTWTTCRDHLQAAGHRLSVYNTIQNAADVDAIRTALGYTRVNLYGASYGSHLAQAVIRDFPKGIRSATMASVWPLGKSFMVSRTATNASGILRLLDACAGDEACNAAFPDLKERLFEVVDRLNAEPVPVNLTNPSNGKVYAASLTGDIVVENLIIFLYLTDVIPVLPQAIFDVYGGDYNLMAQLSSTKLSIFGLATQGVLLPTLCTEDLIGQTPEDFLAAMAEVPRQLAGSADPDTILDYGLWNLCDQWPVEEADPRVREPLRSDLPILIIGGEFDPVTPPEYGRLVSSHLSNSHFFELPGVGHDVTANECAQSLVGAFVTDPGAEPDAGCVDEMSGVAFTVPVDAQNIEFEAYSNPSLGIEGVVPVGWNEVQPGIFARSSPTVDMAVFQITADKEAGIAATLEALSARYGLAGTPEVRARREANDLTWFMYTFEVQGVPRDLALAEADGATLVLILRSSPEEHDALHEAVFLPLLDGLTPIG